MFANLPQSRVSKLCGPQVKILEGGEFDDDVSTAARDMGEAEVQGLQVAKRANAEDLTQVIVRALLEAEPDWTFLLLLWEKNGERVIRKDKINKVNIICAIIY